MRLDFKLVVGACVITAILIFTLYNTGVTDTVMHKVRTAAEYNFREVHLQSDKLNLVQPEIDDVHLPELEEEIIEIFSEVVDVPYPHENLHPDNLTLIDLHPFTMEINQDICNVSKIALVTIIHSAVQNTDARKVIRETWGNPTIPGVNTRLVFLVGQPVEPEKEDALKAEAYMFGDIVQGDFLDTYHNLSYKNVFGKLWVSNFCEQAEFVVKTDDDMFIDLYATYHITRQYLTHPKYLQNEFILCPTWYGMPILRDPNSKWYVSYDDISQADAPDNSFPPYCTGWIYIVNPGTAGRLTEVAKTTKFFWIDDAWVTGYLAGALGIKHVDLIEFFVMEMERMILMKTVQNPEIYHRDYLAAPNARNYEISYTLHKHAEWCYRNKCNNNMYRSKETLSDTDQIVDRLMDKYKLNVKS